MPELPEVETVRRGLAPAMQGRFIVRADVHRPDIRRSLPAGLSETLSGSRILGLRRRGKYLLMDLDNGSTVLWHLGMSGQMRLHRPGEGTAERLAHTHIELHLDDGACLQFTDPRRFGMVDLYPTRDEACQPSLAGLGPEPLGPDFGPACIREAAKGRRLPLKSFLMDQRVVAGLGNIYACEILYGAGLSPLRQARTLGPKRAGALHRATRTVLEAAIEAGGSTLRDHRLADGSLGYFQHGFWVYDRAGRSCPDCQCDTARTGGIRRLIQSGRSTFYCPRMQR